MFKVKKIVKHKTFGKDIVMQILDSQENEKSKEYNLYHCRYFVDGVFHSADFYEFELELTD